LLEVLIDLRNTDDAAADELASVDAASTIERHADELARAIERMTMVGDGW
jgi:hypothetical protein